MATRASNRARSTAADAGTLVAVLVLVLLPLAASAATSAPDSGATRAGGVPVAVVDPVSVSDAAPAVPRSPVCTGPAVPALPGASSPGGATAETEPPTYYAIELVPTRRVPGTRRSAGTAEVTFERSPFGVAVAPDGSYSYALRIRVDGLRPRDDADYVVWVTRSDLSEIRRVGILSDAGRIDGKVGWNKFLVVVTLEPADADAETWQGPIVLRGMSRSGRMHTMAGHGPFQAEPCVKYGYK